MGDTPPQSAVDMDGLLPRLQALATALAGFELEARHVEPLRQRFCGFRDNRHSIREFLALIEACERGNRTAIGLFINVLTIKHSSFFRNPWHFDLAAEHALWRVGQGGRARLWCAAVSTGQEAWSLAMAVSEVFAGRLPPGQAPPVDILATDIDAVAIRTARKGRYPLSSLTGGSGSRDSGHGSHPLLSRYLHPVGGPGAPAGAPAGTQAGTQAGPQAGEELAVDDRLRRLVSFQVMNLIDSSWDVPGPCDVILCRNVLMYLDRQHRYEVLERLTSCLSEDGFLMLDPAEHPGNAASLYVARGGGVYTLADRIRKLSFPKIQRLFPPGRSGIIP